MSRPRQAQEIPIDIPLRGMSTRYPQTKMPSQFSPWIQNLDLEVGCLETPLGVDRRFNAIINYIIAMADHPTDPDSIVHFDNSGSDIKARSYNPFDDTGGSIITGGESNQSSRAITKLGFNNRVFIFQGNAKTAVFDGSTLGEWSVSGPSDYIVGGFAFRERMYVFEDKSKSIWYGSVGGVAGTFTEFPLDSITESNGLIMCGFAFTLSSGLDSQALWAVVLTTGEVIIYSGTYPAAPDWVLVGKTKIAAPVGYQSFVEVNGDVLVITKAGIISIRNLILGGLGSQKVASLTDEIEKYWTFVIQKTIETSAQTEFDPMTSDLALIHGAYHQIKNKLVIFLPYAYIPGTGAGGDYVSAGADISMALIYDFANQGWTVRLFTNIPNTSGRYIVCSFYHANSDLLFLGCDDENDESGLVLWGSDGYQDVNITTADITGRIITAPMVGGGVKDIKSTRLIHSGSKETKSTVAVTMRGNLGAKVSQPTSHAITQDGITDEIYNAGVEARVIQADISVTMDENADRAYQIFDIAPIVEPGGLLG